jgi:hypothetical protein
MEIAPTLSLGKCWNSPSSPSVICFAAQITQGSPQSTEPSTTNKTERTKGFLTIEMQNLDNPIRFSKVKPDMFNKLSSPTGLSAIIRKHLQHATVCEIRLFPLTHDDKSICLWLGTPSYVLKFERKSPFEIEFITPAQISLFRHSQKGLFTVAKKISDEDFLQYKPSSPHIQKASTQALCEYLISSYESDHHGSKASPLAASPGHLAKATGVLGRLKRRLRTLNRTLLGDQSKIKSRDFIDHFETLIHHLQDQLHRFKNTSDATSYVNSLQSGLLNNEDVISFDPALSLGENLNVFFVSLKKMRRGLELWEPRLVKISSQIEQIKQDITKLKSGDLLSSDELDAITRRSGLSRKSQVNEGLRPSLQSLTALRPLLKSSLGRTFLSRDGHRIIMGRSAKENDQLTKGAKGNDWWIHVATSHSGSHVIVPRNQFSKDQSPDRTLFEASVLALHFSARKNALEGEVHLTTRSMLKKKKGMPPGLWLIEKSVTRLIRYTSKDLEDIFSREAR